MVNIFLNEGSVYESLTICHKKTGEQNNLTYSALLSRPKF